MPGKGRRWRYATVNWDFFAKIAKNEFFKDVLKLVVWSLYHSFDHKLILSKLETKNVTILFSSRQPSKQMLYQEWLRLVKLLSLGSWAIASAFFGTDMRKGFLAFWVMDLSLMSFLSCFSKQKKNLATPLLLLIRKLCTIKTGRHNLFAYLWIDLWWRVSTRRTKSRNYGKNLNFLEDSISGWLTDYLLLEFGRTWSGISNMSETSGRTEIKAIWWDGKTVLPEASGRTCFWTQSRLSSAESDLRETCLICSS